MAEFLQFDWHQSRSLYPDFPEKLTTKPQTEQDQATIIKTIRHQIREDDELKSAICCDDDKTLLKFLYARKFNIPDTVALIQNYCWYRKRNPLLFQDFDCNAPDIRKALENGLPGVLQSKDRKGRCVLIINATNWDCSYSLVSVYRSILVSLEHLILDLHNQARGFVVIVDWTEFTFRQSTNLKPSIIRLMIEGLQDCFPARFKGIHFIGQPWYVEAALTIIKQFLKEKTKERIFVHGNNLSTLHDYVHKDILPAELGGEKPSYNPQWWMETLQNANK